MRSLSLLLICFVLALGIESRAAEPPREILVTINGTPVRGEDLETLFLVNRITPENRERHRETLIEQLIDNTLVEGFLKRKKVVPDSMEVDGRLAYVVRNIEARGAQPEEVLGRLGLKEATLRQHLALPIAWNSYVRKTIAPDQVKEYFAAHREELDGSKVRIRQIVRLVDRKGDASQWAAAETMLGKLRESIGQGTTTFKAAAREHSESPSKEAGGEVDWFGFDGKMPREVTEAAFRLQPDAISPPVRSPVGVHLLQLIEKKPGDLSAEDVRPRILERIAEEMWRETVATERKTAKIVRGMK